MSHNEKQVDGGDLAAALLKSRLQLSFNIDRLGKKYSRRELSEFSSRIEIDLASGEVYAPHGTPSHIIRSEIDKYKNDERHFGFAQLSAPYNGVNVFGRKYIRRMKECNVIDNDFNAYLKSRHLKRRLPRFLVRETVKEVICDRSVDYLNYVMKKENLPENLFCQQYRVDFYPKLALLPEEIQNDESTLKDVSTLCSVPSTSNAPMILDASCTKSKECSPTRTQPIITDNVRSDRVLLETTNRMCDIVPQPPKVGIKHMRTADFFTSTKKRENNKRRISNTIIERKTAKNLTATFSETVPIVSKSGKIVSDCSEKTAVFAEAEKSVHSIDFRTHCTSGEANHGSTIRAKAGNKSIPHLDIPNGFWNESVHSVLNSYYSISSQIVRKFLGFDIEDLRKEIHDKQQTALSFYVNAMSNYQIVHRNNDIVDSGLKEDRRVMAAAKSRNRRLKSGYHV